VRIAATSVVFLDTFALTPSDAPKSQSMGFPHFPPEGRRHGKMKPDA